MSEMTATNGLLDELLFVESNEFSIEDAIQQGAEDIVVGDGKGEYKKFESTLLMLSPKDEPDKVRSLTVRFLPNIIDLTRPFILEGGKVRLKDKDGSFTILCDPNATKKTRKRWENLSFELRGNDDDFSKFAKEELLTWGKSSVCLVQVISDSRHPENENKVFHFMPQKDHAEIINKIGVLSDEDKANGVAAPFLYSLFESPRYKIEVSIDNKPVEKGGVKKTTEVRNFSGCKLLYGNEGVLKAGIVITGIKDKAEYLAGFDGCVFSSTGYTKPDGTVVPFKDEEESKKIIRDIKSFFPIEYVTSDGKVFNKKSEAEDAQKAVNPKETVKSRLHPKAKTATAEKIAKFEGCEMLQAGYKMPRTDEQKKKNQQGTMVKYTTVEDSVLGFALIKFFLNNAPTLENFMYKPVDPEKEARALKLCDDIEGQAEWIVKAKDAKAKKNASKTQVEESTTTNAAQQAAAESTQAPAAPVATGNPVLDGLLANAAQ